jgi:hypothetical protein
VSRAAGSHRQQPRTPVIDPDAGEGREIGMSDRMQGYPSPIPGGADHVVNAETMRQQVPVPDSEPEITDLNAHGVPPGSATSRERAETMRGPNTHKPPRPQYAPEGKKMPEPVPVTIVQQGDKGGSYRSAVPHSFVLHAAGLEPVRLCGRDQSRARVLLLNESTSSDIRFAMNISDLNEGDGALLPWPNNSYLPLTTQDELWAISADSGTPRISVIQEFDTNG